MDQAKEFLSQYQGFQAYVVFYFTLIGCGIGMPINSDITLIAASVLAALGFFKLPFLIPVAFLGLLSGDTINYLVARKFGPRILKNAPFRWILTPEKIEQAERFLENRGTKFIFFVRFLPLIRTALYFTAGSLQVRARTFFLLDATSTVIYLLGLMNLAYLAGENIEALIEGFKRFQFALLGFLVLTATGVLLRQKWTRREPTA
jgi:membrane protein DedA with SNARE-associated domain